MNLVKDVLCPTPCIAMIVHDLFTSLSELSGPQVFDKTL